VRRTRTGPPASGRRLRSLTAAVLVAVTAGGFALLTACDNSSGNGSSGQTTPGGPPTTGTFSGTLPSALDSLASAAQQTASAAVSSAKAAASSFEASVEAGAGATEATSELAKVDGQGNAVKDVQLTGFPKAQTGGFNAVLVNITNSSDQTASYAVKVEFADSSGQVVDSTVVGSRDVAAGKSAQPIAFSTKDSDKTLFPRVAQAQRY
jgi:hypothetical protein